MWLTTPRPENRGWGAFWAKYITWNYHIRIFPFGRGGGVTDFSEKKVSTYSVDFADRYPLGSESMATLNSLRMLVTLLKCKYKYMTWIRPPRGGCWTFRWVRTNRVVHSSSHFSAHFCSHFSLIFMFVPPFSQKWKKNEMKNGYWERVPWGIWKKEHENEAGVEEIKALVYSCAMESWRG